MYHLLFLAKPTIMLGQILAMKVVALSGFRFAENGFDGPATLEDLKNDHRVLSAIGVDGAKLVPAIARLQMSDSFEAITCSAHDIKRALDHLPEKTRRGLDNSIGLSRIIDAALRYGLVNSGKSILKRRTKKEEIQEAIARYYFGLFLVGRGSGQLNDHERTNVILTLTSLHGMRKRPEDLAVNSILQTWMPEKAFALGEALMKVHEAFILVELAEPPMFKVHITNALGGEAVLQDDDILTDLTARFPENPGKAA